MPKVAKLSITERYAILGNKSYGLYAGVVDKITPQEDGTLLVEVSECRHISVWYGKTGGITSLAVYGICGPRAKESRIGAPTTATLSGIVNIFDCTPEARASIEAVEQK